MFTLLVLLHWDLVIPFQTAHLAKPTWKSFMMMPLCLPLHLLSITLLLDYWYNCQNSSLVSIQCQRLVPVGIIFSPSKMHDNVITSCLTVCPYLWARLPSYLEINLDTVKDRYENLRCLNQKNLNLKNGSTIFYLHNTRAVWALKKIMKKGLTPNKLV